MNETYVNSWHKAEVGPTSSLLVSGCLISVPTLAGRIFESKDYMFHHCLC